MQGGSSFDQKLLAEVERDIAGLGGFMAGMDVEDQILALDAESKGEQDEILRRGQLWYEFVNGRQYPMFKQYFVDIERRRHREFEEAKTDPNDVLRVRWHSVRDLAREIIGNIEGAATMYEEHLRNGVSETTL